MVQTLRDLSSESYILFEHFLSIPGLNKNILVILGQYSSGLFLAIPELGISCDLSMQDGATKYNETQLMDCGLNIISAKELALYIDNWICCNSKFMSELRQKNFNILRKRIKMLQKDDIVH